MASELQYLIIHCSDTRPSFKVTKAILMKWHMIQRGWDRLGYSDLIHRDGEIENLTPYDDDNLVQKHEVTWGAAGVNYCSRHVCLEGGRNYKNEGGVYPFEDIFTDAQFTSLVGYVKQFLKDQPQAKVTGHNLFSDIKTCPNFNVAGLMLLAGIPGNKLVTEFIK